MAFDSATVVEADDDEKSLVIDLTGRERAVLALAVPSSRDVTAQFDETKALITRCAYDITSERGKRATEMLERSRPCVELIRSAAEGVVANSESTIVEKTLATTAVEVATKSTLAMSKVDAAATDPAVRGGTAELLDSTRIDLSSLNRVSGHMMLESLRNVRQPLVRMIEAGEPIEDRAVVSALDKCIEEDITANRVLGDSRSNDIEVNAVISAEIDAHSELAKAVAASPSIDETTKKEVASMWQKVLPMAKLTLNVSTFASVSYGWYLIGSLVVVSAAMAAGSESAELELDSMVDNWDNKHLLAISTAMVVPSVHYLFSSVRSIWSAFMESKTDTTETEAKTDTEVTEPE